MEDWVERDIAQIRAWHSSPLSAEYAATRLAHAVASGAVADWRTVYQALSHEWRIQNQAAGRFLNIMDPVDEEALDAARARCLFAEGFNRMYGYALFVYRYGNETCEDIDHQEPGYFDRRDGDLSTAARDAEEANE